MKNLNTLLYPLILSSALTLNADTLEDKRICDKEIFPSPEEEAWAPALSDDANPSDTDNDDSETPTDDSSDDEQ